MAGVSYVTGTLSSAARACPLFLRSERRQVGERDRLLRGRAEVAQHDVAVGQLVADDHREVRAVLDRRLELAAELARREVGADREALRPEVASRSAAARPSPSGSAPTTTAERRLRGRVDALLLEREQDPVEPEPEPDPRRRLAAEQLDQAVVAAAAAERRLLARRPRPVELERRPRVVVEAADEAGLDDVVDAQRVEVGAERREVVRAGVAQAVGDPRRVARSARPSPGPWSRAGAAGCARGGRARAAAGGRRGRGSRPSAPRCRPAGTSASPIELTWTSTSLEPGVAVEARARARSARRRPPVPGRRSPRRRTARTGGSGRPAAGRSGTSARSASDFTGCGSVCMPCWT